MEKLKTTARYQVDAEKIDGGLIRGYLVIDGGIAYIYVDKGKFEIKHDTVKPVAVECIKIENPKDCAVCRCPVRSQVSFILNSEITSLMARSFMFLMPFYTSETNEAAQQCVLQTLLALCPKRALPL